MNRESWRLCLHIYQVPCRMLGMNPKRTKLSDQVRNAVNASGGSRYAICKAGGIDQSTISRFMAGKIGLSWQTLDALADVLGLDVVARGPVRVLPRKKPGRKARRKAGQS